MAELLKSRVIRFGVFEADSRTQELRKHGLRLKLPRQSFQVLQMLLEKPGELVTREELHRALWPADTFVDFENGLNNAVKRIRNVLNDSPEAPRFIETLPRLGYRFVGTVDARANGSDNGTDSFRQVLGQTDFGNGNGVGGKEEESTEILRPTETPASRPWWHAAAFAIAGIAVIGLGVTFWRAGHSRVPPTLTMAPLTSYPGLEVSPTFSPDGNKVAFAWTNDEKRDDQFDLYVKVIGTETPVQLTHTPALGLFPTWSPDGRFIAFVRLTTQGQTESAGLYLIPAVGGPERKLADLVVAPFVCRGSLTWTPDGKFLIFAGPRATDLMSSHVMELNLETLEQRRLKDPEDKCQFITFPSVSPDGRLLAEACQLTYGLSAIYVTPLSGGTPRMLIQNEGDLGGIAWSNDGNSLIYSLRGELWRIKSSGGTPERLWFGQDAEGPAIAPTGDRLAYMRTAFSSDLWSVRLEGGPRIGTGAAVRFAAANVDQKNPEFSPDGKRVAFESMRSGNPEIWISNADGTNLLQLTNFRGALTGTPRWSPDGRQIVFDSRASGKPELYVIGADGGSPRLLSTTSQGGSVPYWSHDGRWIYFVGGSAHDLQLYKVHPEGGAPVQLTHQGGFLSQEGPDGKRLYYTKMGEVASIWSVSVDGGDELPVAGIPNMTWPGFVVSRDGIFYYDTVGIPNVYFLDFATNKVNGIGRLPGNPTAFQGGIAVSPDGRHLLYPQVTEESSDLMLVEGFR